MAALEANLRSWSLRYRIEVRSLSFAISRQINCLKIVGNMFCGQMIRWFLPVLWVNNAEPHQTVFIHSDQTSASHLKQYSEQKLEVLD